MRYLAVLLVLAGCKAATMDLGYTDPTTGKFVLMASYPVAENKYDDIVDRCQRHARIMDSGCAWIREPLECTHFGKFETYCVYKGVKIPYSVPPRS